MATKIISACTNFQDLNIMGILMFFVLILCGIGLVSVHYRMKYERLKARLKSINVSLIKAMAELEKQ
jgi:hypothetical protein